MSATQGRGEEAHRLLEGRVEAGDTIKNRVTQQPSRGRPAKNHTKHLGITEFCVKCNVKVLCYTLLVYCVFILLFWF